MAEGFWKPLRWAFGPGPEDGHLWPRWLFLRALGLICFSAFYSFYFQINGLIGPSGILPAERYLNVVWQQLGPRGIWYAPTLLWFGSGSTALGIVCWAGLVASILLTLNLWPRAAIGVCLITYLSFIAAAQDFSSYQSDGMLLEALFICLFFAPRGLRPGLGEKHPPSRASLFLLQWEWFRIYFESGFVKLASHDPEWRHLTAMDHYYENGPLPNWIGWYVQQLPHGFHAAVTLATLAIELGIVWMMFLPRRFRQVCFFIVTPFQISIILTANLAFINHLTLVLGILLLDDRFLRGLGRFWPFLKQAAPAATPSPPELPPVVSALNEGLEPSAPAASPTANQFPTLLAAGQGSGEPMTFAIFRRKFSLVFSVFFLAWDFYVTTVLLFLMVIPSLPAPMDPVIALDPFRIANQYGLFAVMTKARYEIEFQGTLDGKTWIPYPFRYKPQDPQKAPRVYAPYQPRFDWNLWFASLGSWRDNLFVLSTEHALLFNDPSVLKLFAGNPFEGAPPTEVRAVVWRYWFTDLATKRATGLWWNRKFIGLYAPTLSREPDGSVAATDMPPPGVP